MNRKNQTSWLLWTLRLGVATLVSHGLQAHAQGSLVPPAGPPAPVMKTLGQIEPRTPISTAPYTINQPGSYYLTTNLTTASDGIIIATNGVTLDLGGWTIASTAFPATGSGIHIQPKLQDLTIHNGHIRGGVTNNGSGDFSGPGFLSGIAYNSVIQGIEPANVLVSHLSVSGCLNLGVYLGTENSTVIESTTVNSVGGFGLTASAIKGSSAMNTAYGIIADQISDSRGEAVSSKFGGSPGITGTTVQNCNGFSTANTGINARVLQNCNGRSVSGTGIYALEMALNCTGNSYSGAGLHSDGTAQNCQGYTLTGGPALSARVASYCDATLGGVVGISLKAEIAIGCTFFQNGVTAITHKYNMP